MTRAPLFAFAAAVAVTASAPTRAAATCDQIAQLVAGGGESFKSLTDEDSYDPTLGEFAAKKVIPDADECHVEGDRTAMYCEWNLGPGDDLLRQRFVTPFAATVAACLPPGTTTRRHGNDRIPTSQGTYWADLRDDVDVALTSWLHENRHTHATTWVVHLRVQRR